MAEETITILKVGTEEAVRSVNDLRSNIKTLKASLGELEIGTQEYQNTLDELKVNQNALKDAMYATSGTFQDVVDAATGASKSYNSLVHQMAALKEEWRATNDEARRNELGVQIAGVNKQLKDMDASVGNFQRNVGNYSSALDGLKEGFLATAGGAGAVINPVKNVTMGFKALSATPVIGILGLLANVLIKVIDGLDSSEENANRMTIALAPLKSGATALTKVFQFLGDKLADVAEWMTKILDRMGLVDDMMKEHQSIAQEEIALTEERRRVEMANADTTLEIAKLRAQSAEKDKYTAAERLKFIEEAAQKEREIADRNIEIARREYDVLMRKSELAGNSKEENDALADAYVRLQNAETDYFNKTRELSAQRVEAINQIKSETKANQDLLQSKKDIKTFEDEYEGFVEDDPWAEAEKQQEEKDAFWNGLLERLRMREESAQQEIDLEMAVQDEITAYIAEQNEKRRKEEEKTAEARIDTLYALSDTTASVLGSMADFYEADEANAKKNAGKIKALRIAEATINTISGAVGAFMQAVGTIPPPFGIIAGAAQAAAVTVAGIAQIAKIKSTNVNGTSGSSGASLSSMSVSAPNVDTELQSVRNVTSASEEDRLNRMAKDSKVFIVSSEMEASLQDTKVRIEESSF